MRSLKDRIAVVVVHGMGNQYPMDTLRGFVKGIHPPDAVMYSSPNRVTSDMEVRRLSFDNAPFDYFEYYWAHYMEEPGIGEIIRWSLKLLFIKTPSNSLKKHIYFVRIGLLAFVTMAVFLGLGLYWKFEEKINGVLSIAILGISYLALLKFIWTLISASIIGTIQASIGDVLKYTIPSPKNIAVRDKIRKNGLELIRNLHEVKKPDGSPRYAKIIVIGHSLGSIVAFDILTSLFSEYHWNYKNIPAYFKQSTLKTLRDTYDHPDHADHKYQNLQAELYNEYQHLGNQWKVSHFITLGSPLTHASMILSKGEDDFKQKKDFREFPISPPVLDKEDDHFAYKANYKSFVHTPVTIKILHHAALFAMTQWTNIYFENDWIGGPLENEFGKGIRDIPVKVNHKWLSWIPCATHTLYWDTRHDESLQKLKAILDTVVKEPYETKEEPDTDP